MCPANENEFWTSIKGRLLDEVDLKVFKNWSVVRSIPLYLTHSLTEFYSAEVSKLLKNRSDRKDWFKVLREPFLGHDEESYKDAYHSILDNVECTSWTLKSAHHLLIFELISGHTIHDYKQIVEFGAGIGETARIIRDLGFIGDYYIYDLPEVSRISQFYLENWSKAVHHYHEIPTDKKTLFIATWSLSEVPLKYRNEIANHFKSQDFLIVFQNTGLGYDNFSYFNDEFCYVSETFYRLRRLFLGTQDFGSHYMFALGKGNFLSEIQ